MEELIDYGRNQLGIKDVQTWDLSFISEKLREVLLYFILKEIAFKKKPLIL